MIFLSSNSAFSGSRVGSATVGQPNQFCASLSGVLIARAAAVDMPARTGPKDTTTFAARR